LKIIYLYKIVRMSNDQNNEIYSKSVRAGKRTYFFDVKSTKSNDLYITVTESKKVTSEDGYENYQKHKIFLYKEDFEKFKEGLEDVLKKIEELKG
jgi:CRISPR/Cas system CSM-associated protein Csm2 small subunit